MLRSQRAQTVVGEECLHGHRHLAPERAVVVEDRDPFVERHIISAAFGRHTDDKLGDRLFRGGVVPGR